MTLFGFTTLTATPANPTTSVTMTVGDTSEWDAAPFSLVIKRKGQRPRSTNCEVVLITAYAAGSITAMTRAQNGTTALSLQAGDECYPRLIASSSAYLVGTGGTFPGTRVGLQAAWDALPDTGGATLEMVPNTTITGDGTKVLFSGKEDITFKPNGLTLKGPATANPYLLLQIGSDDTTGTTGSTTSAGAVIGDHYLVMNAVSSYTRGQVVIINNGTNYQYNRIQIIDPVSLRVYFDHAMGYINGIGTFVYSLPNMMKGYRQEGRINVKAGSNTNYGLAAGVTLGTVTTIPAGAARGAFTGVVTSFTGFADADYVLITDGTYHEIKSITSHAGTTVTFGQPHFQKLSAATTMSKLTNGLTDMGSSAGILGTYLDTPYFEEVYGEDIFGSAYSSNAIYEPHYEYMHTLRCGAPFNVPYAHGLSFIFETGGYYNVQGDESAYWGPGSDMLVDGRGSFTGSGNYFRNIKHSWMRNSTITNRANDNAYATGIAMASYCLGNTFYNYAVGNGGTGSWFDNTGSTGNTVFVFARKNNINGVDLGDVYVGPLDTGNNVYVLNDDAVIQDNANAVVPTHAPLTADGTGISLSAAETAILTKALYIGQLSKANVLRGTCSGVILHNAGGNRTVQFKLKFGATTLIDKTTLNIPSNASNRPFQIVFTIHNYGSVFTDQRAVMRVEIGLPTAGGTGDGDLTTAAPLLAQTLYGLSAIDSSGLVTVQLTATLSANDFYLIPITSMIEMVR